MTARMASFMAMSSCSVAEAKNNLPKLLDRMLAGEAVTITRRGVPVARLEPAQEVVPTSGPIDMEWLKRVRIKFQAPMDSVTLIRRMRTEGT